jgi:hypothetical protein
MGGCGHERIVRRKYQIWGEYRVTSLCQLSGSPSRILCVEKGLAVCVCVWKYGGALSLEYCGVIMVGSCQICGGHGGTKMGFS